MQGFSPLTCHGPSRGRCRRFAGLESHRSGMFASTVARRSLLLRLLRLLLFGLRLPLGCWSSSAVHGRRAQKIQAESHCPCPAASMLRWLAGCPLHAENVNSTSLAVRRLALLLVLPLRLPPSPHGGKQDPTVEATQLRRLSGRGPIAVVKQTTLRCTPVVKLCDVHEAKRRGGCCQHITEAGGLRPLNVRRPINKAP